MKILKLTVLLAILPFVARCEELAYDGKPIPGPPAVLARGFTNIVFCWVEIPQRIVHRGLKVPLVGAVWGAVEGTGGGLARAVGGTMDIFSLGFSGEGIYSESLPYWPWEGEWVPTGYGD